jgi:hypothetical protein
MADEYTATIESRNLMLLKNQMRLEALAAKKCELYAGYFQDPELKSRAQQLALHHRDNISSLVTYLDGLR